MCQNGPNQTDGTSDSFPVWSHPSKKPPEVKKDTELYDVTSGRGGQGTSRDWA